ncbi:RNA polymerase sigma factor [Chungangia koreensis]|uniref:RNA polymerase sigma factor n=1 Tax=Chungangia koreensis TaxID=752657 RepID=A0ABV8X4P9_9LACT
MKTITGMFIISLYFTNSKQDAEDITQETFIKAMRNIHQLTDRGKEKSWILAVARNTAIDLIRKQKLIRLLPEKIRKDGSETQNPSAVKGIMAEETWMELQDALLRLKPRYRSVVILRALNELNIKETAEALNCSEGKVRVDYHRALKMLKSDLKLNEGWLDYEQSKTESE